jgi:hypothetical protein
VTDTRADPTRAAVVDTIEAIEYGWRIKETATHFVDVCPMLFNDRICLTPKAAPGVYDYGWCYDKGGAAIYAAIAWNPDTEAEPAGFKKRVAMFGPRQI